MNVRWSGWLRIGREASRVALPHVGLLVGPLGLTIVTVALYSLFDPEAFRDGQFRMIYLVTVPFGLLLGWVAGACLRLMCAHERRAGGLCAGIGGSTVLLLAIALASLGGFSFGYLEIFAILAAAGSLTIGGALMLSSGVRAERWARFRRPLGERRQDPWDRLPLARGPHAASIERFY